MCQVRQGVVIGFLMSIIATTMMAHPSYGFFVTRDGSVVFADLLHEEGCVRKVSPDGKLTTLIDHQHVHWIFPGPDGRIWGTNHEYLPATEENRNTLWKLDPDGSNKRVVIRPTRDPAMFSGVNFVILPDETIVFNHAGQLFRRTADSQPERISDFKFDRIMSLQLATNGDIIIADTRAHNGSLYRMTLAGEVTLIADNLKEIKPADPPFREPRFNMLYASFMDSAGVTFVANAGSRRITAISPSGAVSHIYHSTSPWYPVAYTSGGGKAYVMEMAFVSGRGNLGPRIVEITDGKEKELVSIDRVVSRGQACSGPQLLVLQVAAGLSLCVLILALILGWKKYDKIS